jgi:uncharacterized protein YqjF (DUF2071 family)
MDELTAEERVAPARRPAGRPIGLQSWRDLLFVHWPLPVDAVRHAIPRRLTPDLLDGVAYVGLVPFAMRRIRPAWLPGPLGLDFLETNLRLYVHLDGCDPGVLFLSLEASSRIAVAVARRSFGLPYHFARMSMERRDREVRYESARAGDHPRLALRFQIGDALGPSLPGSAEHFLLERYYLYVERGGRLFRGQVHHVPYPAHRASVHELEDEIVGAAGLPAPAGAPAFVHFSPGVDVEIFAPHAV